MARPRHTPIAPVLRVLMRLGQHATLPEMAVHLGLSPYTVRTWDRRGSVPPGRLQELARIYGSTVERIQAESELEAQAYDSPRVQDELLMDRESEPADAVTYEQAGATGALSVADGAGDLGAWSVDVSSSALPPQPGGAMVGNHLHEGLAGCLIPAQDTSQHPPLVVSLKGAGGAQAQYYVIPRRLRAASAGAGDGPAIGGPEIDLAGDIACSERWLRRTIGRPVDSLTTVEVVGDSMAPTLDDGEIVVIDRTSVIKADGIYVLDLPDRRIVKRVQRLVDGSIVLISDNQAYQRETLDRGKARHVRVVGRVVWPHLR